MKVFEKFGFGIRFQGHLKTILTNLKSKIILNGFLSEEISIEKSVRQGCPIAPLLYICAIEPLLINIRNNKEIEGIKSPTSDKYHLISAFADDTGFIIKNMKSKNLILSTFEKFGKASGSKINKDKTEGMLLGALKHINDLQSDIKWVKSTKSLGIHFGIEGNEVNRLNWLNCLDRFKIDILMQMRRQVTLQGKADILNYIGYSKLWYRATIPSIPEKCADKTKW